MNRQSEPHLPHFGAHGVAVVSDLPHLAPARLYAMLGDLALVWPELEKAVADRDGALEWIKVEPVWAPLRDDPRFARLVARIGLPPG